MEVLQSTRDKPQKSMIFQDNEALELRIVALLQTLGSSLDDSQRTTHDDLNLGLLPPLSLLKEDT